MATSQYRESVSLSLCMVGRNMDHDGTHAGTDALSGWAWRRFASYSIYTEEHSPGEEEG